MAAPVQVKYEHVGDVFCADTDSEDADIDIDKLQPLAFKFASSSKFPIGCKVWYNLRTSPETGHMQAKSAQVVEVSIHVENLRRVCKVKPEAPEEHMTSFYEDQLVYAISCPVRITKTGRDEAFDGVVVYLERKGGNDGRRQVTYAVQYSEDNYIKIEPGVAAERIKFRADDCGVGVDGKDSKSSTTTQDGTTCTHEGDTDKEEKEEEVSVQSSSTKSLAPVKCDDHNANNQSNSLDITNPRWAPPSPSQRKRSSGSGPDVSYRPTKVAKREIKSGEKSEGEREASNDKAENTVSLRRTLAIPLWWKNQCGPEKRQQLSTLLNGEAKLIKSSTNCLIGVHGNNPNEKMRITIESCCRDSKSKQNSIRHATYIVIVEKTLIEFLADERSKMRLLFDLAWSDPSQLIHSDSTCGPSLLQKEIFSSPGSKSKKWWYLRELPCGRGMHPDDFTSLRSKLPKGSDCNIEVFERSAKVLREAPYVLVSGTKKLDVKNAALMVEDAVQSIQGFRPSR